jgi:hypothetical protein
VVYAQGPGSSYSSWSGRAMSFETPPVSARSAYASKEMYSSSSASSGVYLSQDGRAPAPIYSPMGSVGLRSSASTQLGLRSGLGANDISIVGDMMPMSPAGVAVAPQATVPQSPMLRPPPASPGGLHMLGRSV